MGRKTVSIGVVGDVVVTGSKANCGIACPGGDYSGYAGEISAIAGLAANLIAGKVGAEEPGIYKIVDVIKGKRTSSATVAKADCHACSHRNQFRVNRSVCIDLIGGYGAVYNF